jgi:hypothetical protein
MPFGETMLVIGLVVVLAGTGSSGSIPEYTNLARDKHSGSLHRNWERNMDIPTLLSSYAEVLPYVIPEEL